MARLQHMLRAAIAVPALVALFAPAGAGAGISSAGPVSLEAI